MRMIFSFYLSIYESASYQIYQVFRFYNLTNLAIYIVF